MKVRAHDDPDEFAALAGPLYAADPVTHTLAITVLTRFLHDPAFELVMLTVHEGDEPAGAVFRTAPRPLVVSGLPAAAATAAAEVLAAIDPELPGVTGPRAEAEAFARAWTEVTGAGVREAMAMRLYELGDLRTPAVSGAGRAATEADLPLLLRWQPALQREIFGHDRELDRTAEIIRKSLTRGDLQLLWEDGGQPVAWAHVGPPAHGMSRIGPVYTPPEARRRGYGSAATAAVSRWARDSGAEHVLLFTDLANPTSNSIYQKLGYRPVHDSCELEFTPAP